MLADWWVTSMSAAIRPLQEWARVKPDGQWGSENGKGGRYRVIVDPTHLVALV